jgi:hypothetical protein
MSVFYDFVCQHCKSQDGLPLYSPEEWAERRGEAAALLGDYGEDVERVSKKHWLTDRRIPAGTQHEQEVFCELCESKMVPYLGGGDNTANFCVKWCYGRGSKVSTHMSPTETDHKKKVTSKNGYSWSERKYNQYYKKPDPDTLAPVGRAKEKRSAKS